MYKIGKKWPLKNILVIIIAKTARAPKIRSTNVSSIFELALKQDILF